MAMWTQYRRQREREDYKRSIAVKLVWLRVLKIYS